MHVLKIPIRSNILCKNNTLILSILYTNKNKIKKPINKCQLLFFFKNNDNNNIIIYN